MTALHYAAHNGQTEVVKVLLENKAQIDAVTPVSQDISIVCTVLSSSILYCVLLLLLL